MIRRLAIGVCAMAIGTMAWAQAETVDVSGWARRPAVVATFNADGVPLGQRNLDAIPISGQHPWNRDYDIVQVGDVWVERSVLISKLCRQIAPPPKPQGVAASAGQQQSQASTGYSSGAGCDATALDRR